MSSLYDEVSRKLDQDPRLTKRGGARFDMSMLLFNHREYIRELWLAADEHLAACNDKSDATGLREAVEKLRIIFGDMRKREE